MRFLRQLGLIGSTFLLSFSALADSADVSSITDRFAKLGIVVEDVAPSEVGSLFEVSTNQGLFFATAKGDYFLQGKLYSLDEKGQFTDVVAKRYAEKIKDYSDSWIEYKADNEKHVVTVFTDIDCGYCLKLHRQMAQYNEAGITVRYMAYPRAGVASDVGLQMANIWCSADPKAAMDEVKLKRTLSNKPENAQKCVETIAQQHDLGAKLGVRGTPAIVVDGGNIVGGYLSPQDLLERLELLN
ncbi:thioredoxin fold domain-containing protein [Vibrio tapetis subsp. quintayensis]|uniref:thioredoxin fold domain-containing protein n=1 Tax=Vibrio tapetis TaxID=52443 RepID=UPI0025B48C83|nr:thioredoxin fold domain-containing protein [Vibrio tapetis]MDN3682739.1 thioredoxin fold domain-containing protein [Vibrio tapetis subsp. quintayensis]